MLAGAAAVVEPAFMSEVLDEEAVVVFELVLVLGAAAAAFWSAVPVVLVVLLAEGVAEVELALELIALWSAVVGDAEVEGAAAVLLDGAADAEVALWSLLVVVAAPVFDAVEDEQESEIFFTLSTLKLLSAWIEPVSSTVLPLSELKSLVLPLSL